MQLSTAILIVAPHEVQAVVMPLLRRYAPNTGVRVPAHFTLLYPFVEYERLDEACAQLQTICAGVSPFEITIEGYGEFPRTLFMTPRDPQPIKAVFKRFLDSFPEYPPYGGAFGNDLIPHVTIGEFDTPKARDTVRAKLPAYEPITFRVTRLHVMYGVENLVLPWLTHAVIPLGG